MSSGCRGFYWAKSTLAGEFLCHGQIQPRTTPKVAAPKGSRGRSESPLVASAEAKSLQQKRPASRENLLPCWSVAPIWRDNMQVVDKAAWGARLRTRKVTGRDASLPAPLLSAFGILVARGTIGALPQTPPEALPLDSARGNFPLDPFRAIELVAFSCFFRVFLLFFVPPLSIPS